MVILCGMSQSDISEPTTDATPKPAEVVFACVMLGIAGYAFYSAAVIVFSAL